MDELTELLIEARGGGGDALTTFVRRTQHDIWRFCRPLVGRDEADDVVQETYLAAWRSMASFRGESSARTWLFVIARRCAERTSYRTRRWRELGQHAPGPTPTAAPESADELDVLLGSLSEDRRIALILTQIMGFSYAETAAILECPIGTVRSRVARAREELLPMLRVNDEGVA